MGGFPVLRHRVAALYGVTLVSLALATTACTGTTTIDPQAQQGQFAVTVRMDPPTLNPPQLGTLNFAVTDTKSGKPVSKFEPVSNVLMHSVVISKDMLFFRHAFTSNLTLGDASLSAYFPGQGRYTAYVLYNPAGAALQTFTTTITTGQEGPDPALVEDAARAKVSGDARVQLVVPMDGYHVGRSQQLLFHVTERGNPVSELWPFLGAAGHLWIKDDVAPDSTLAHEVGASTYRNTGETAVPAAEGTPSGITIPALQGSSSGPGPEFSPIGTPIPVPALDASVAGPLATLTSQPVATLFPVQETAQASVLGAQAVQPSVAFGPDVVFTHTFQHPGLYKMWFEFQYKGRVVTTDHVIRVVK